ncbi:unnamed protein product [Alopecurus aequalis]
MARGLTAASVALLVLVSLVASATSEKPVCCRDYHRWGDDKERSGCPLQEETNDDCNSWCMQSGCARDNISRNGFCKKIGKLHYCHCKC